MPSHVRGTQGRLPVYAAADLSRVDLSVALEGTGFDPKLPTLFTMEGEGLATG
jgi:O-methyltransferase involved in polyketide biosynthesis